MALLLAGNVIHMLMDCFTSVTRPQKLESDAVADLAIRDSHWVTWRLSELEWRSFSVCKL